MRPSRPWVARALLVVASGWLASGTAVPAPVGPGVVSSLDTLVARAYAAGWDTLAIGERVARLGLALEGAPYLEGTLEGPGPEVCRIPIVGFDCVTFMELCLGVARVLHAGSDSALASATGRVTSEREEPGRPAPRAARQSPEDLVRDAVTFTRYRGGRLTDYTSRLHYTAEWIADNVRKGVIEDVTASLGGEPCASPVGYMSAHTDRYPALAAHPAFVDSMRRIERSINRLPRACVPKDRVAEIEPRLRSGDLVAIATSIEGLDYAHTGMIVRDAQGVARFLHASSRHRRVVLDVPLSRYLATGPRSHTGVTILRPLPR